MSNKWQPKNKISTGAILPEIQSHNTVNLMKRFGNANKIRLYKLEEPTRANRGNPNIAKKIAKVGIQRNSNHTCNKIESRIRQEGLFIATTGIRHGYG